MKHVAIVASLNSGINTLTGDGLAEASPRGTRLTIDAGWRKVAEKALEFVKRFTMITARTARNRGGLR